MLIIREPYMHVCTAVLVNTTLLALAENWIPEGRATTNLYMQLSYMWLIKS